MIFEILIGILFSLTTIFVQPAYAQEDPILFWGTTCPFCHVVMDDIEEEGIKEEVNIVELEIYEDRDNQNVFGEKIEECGIDPRMAGVPLLYYDGECYVGPDPIMAQLRRMVNGEEVEDSEEIDEEEIQVDPVIDVTEDEGRRNTGILIVAVIGFLVALVLIGGVLQNKKGSTTMSIFLLVSAMTLFTVRPTFAMCPMCTAAVGIGLGFSRYFGIDDVITGVWIGGLVVSSIMWLLGIMDKKGIKNFFLKALVPISIYGLLGLTLHLLDFIGHPLNTLWGIDKILLGIVLGGIVFFMSGKLHLILKARNNNKVYFPFQKVVFTVSSLLILTIIFYMIVY